MRQSTIILVASMLASLTLGVSHAGVIGFLGNFDVINDTGTRAHGFEIDLEGLGINDISDTFGGANRGFPTTVERYGAPTIVPYASGVSVIYQANYDVASGKWKKADGTFGNSPEDIGTPSGTVQTPGDNCWSGGGIGYSLATPCDHFGIGTLKAPTKTTYNWLIETSPTSDILSKAVVNLPAVAAPVVGQPVVPALPPPPVAMIIQAPPPAPPPPGEPLQWGDPMWVKVFTTEIPDPVPLEDLIFGRPPVDAALAEPPEIEWQLLQVDNANPIGPGNGQLENDNPAPGGDAVVRRYEFYKYAGPVTSEGEAVPVSGNDGQATPCDPANPKSPCDLGDYMGAQNVAINLQGNPVAIPEPESVSIVFVGLSLVGFMARHRKISAK